MDTGSPLPTAMHASIAHTPVGVAAPFKASPMVNTLDRTTPRLR